MKFIIFTNLEDTPTDDYIFDAIPENVLCISAVNAKSHGGKVIPAPYGVQRRMNPQDNRIGSIEQYMDIFQVIHQHYCMSVIMKVQTKKE